MNRQIISIYIKENFGDNLTGASRKLQKTQPRLYDALYEYTDFVPKSSSFTERCYLITNDITERPKCINCDNLLKFKSYKTGYGIKCSNSCKG